MDPYAALQAVINGLLTGALYALVGMGLALIFGVMRIVNFAHGAFMMLGMYVTYVLFIRTGISPYALFVVTGLALFAFGYAVYFALLRPIHGQSDFMQILLTMGIGLICSDAVLLIFGADYHQINIPLQDRNFRFGQQISVNAPWVVSFAIAVGLALALYLFVMRTMTGRAARAIAQNRARFIDPVGAGRLRARRRALRALRRTRLPIAGLLLQLLFRRLRFRLFHRRSIRR